MLIRDSRGRLIEVQDISFPNIDARFAFVPDSDNLYCVSDNGKVFSRKQRSGKILDYWIEKAIDIRGDKENNNLYAWTTIYTNNKRGRVTIHTLMLRSFVGPPPSPNHVGRHKDDVGTNNVLSNLMWGTSRENAFDKVRNGKGSGELNGASKMTQELVDFARSLRADGMACTTIADQIFEVSGVRVGKTTISKICNNLSWVDRSQLGNVLKPFLINFPNHENALAEFTKLSKEHFGES